MIGRIALSLATCVVALAACDGKEPLPLTSPEPATSAPVTIQGTSTAVATPIVPPPGAQRSSVVRDVFVPPGATRDPDDSGPKSEKWDLVGSSYADTVSQEEALLPVGQSLGDLPWCQKTPIPPDSTDNTTWIWGEPNDAVIVSVFGLKDVDKYAWIVVRRSDFADEYCK